MMKSFEVIELELETDQRGWTIDPILHEDFVKSPVENIHIVNLKPGIVRGNHYHKVKTEYICLVGGLVRIVIKNEEMHEEFETTLDCEDPKLITVLPYTIHAVKNVGKHTVYLLCYSNMPYSPEDRDVYRKVILE
jgi:dTDP-4-dehydrorhamnose 3,5-epimerase-like enzyme